MLKRMFRLIAMVIAFFSLVNVARADLLPSGFEFAFFNHAIKTVILAPFSLAGCNSLV
ncbi:MAG: hypothetical protein IID39_03410 [Planctomycetes bacterium]|nr:hypothetical protein [Planctomycetota bacterium]